MSKTWDCFCGNGYVTSRELEYHLSKEHTKGELVHHCRKEAQKNLA
jgi:hypothetical protein